MSYPKNASVSENLARLAVEYHRSAAQLDDDERFATPTLVRRLAGPTAPHRGEGLAAACALVFGLVALALILILVFGVSL